MSRISQIRARETNVPAHLHGELQMEGLPFILTEGFEHGLRNNLCTCYSSCTRTYHELVPNLDTLLERAFLPSCLGEDSVLELDIELRFVWVCPGYIRFLTVGNDGYLRLYVGHEYECSQGNCGLVTVRMELARYLISLKWVLRVGNMDRYRSSAIFYTLYRRPVLVKKVCRT